MHPLRRAARALSRLVPRGTPADSALDRYVHSLPSPQNALDIFKGEWSSRLPEPFASLRAGEARLFEDARITWFAEAIGGVDGRAALELGPLEGGHAYMLEQMGASAIVAVEANTRAFLRCLVVKELLELRRVTFLCGDFLEYLRHHAADFEICIASGVLYHMRNPVELIALLGRSPIRHVLLWTHYYDRDIILRSPVLAAQFSRATQAEHEGFRHWLHRQEYGPTLYQGRFCGGPAPTSSWMTRDEILACLSFFGFEELRVGFDHPDHPHGPAFAVAATRARAPGR